MRRSGLHFLLRARLGPDLCFAVPWLVPFRLFAFGGAVLPLRLIQATLPAEASVTLAELAGSLGADRVWTHDLDGERSSAAILVDAEKTEEITDTLTANFGSTPGFRVIVLAVEATLPRIEQEPKPASAPEKPKLIAGTRISRDELLEDIASATRVNAVYLAMVGLSALVAAIGLLRDQVAVVIGAMVIAPLLGPNVALSLATVLGDMKMLRRALQANAVGVSMAIGMAVVLGLLLHPDPTTPELAARTEVGLSDLALALAAGVAGTLAFTSGLPSTLVGVMVAVALMPPTMAVGLFAGAGRGVEAARAATLLLANVICVNLAGTLTFAIVGVRPRTWWEAGRARRATRLALGLWVVLLGGLVALLVFGPLPGGRAGSPPGSESGLSRTEGVLED